VPSIATGHPVRYFPDAVAKEPPHGRRGHGRTSGRWHGAGVAALGLEGEVDADQVEAIPRLVALIPHGYGAARPWRRSGRPGRGTTEEWRSVHLEDRAETGRHREVRDEHERGAAPILEAFASGLRAGSQHSLQARASS
jgi:nitroreductase